MNYVVEINLHSKSKLTKSVGEYIRPCLDGHHPYLQWINLDGMNCSLFKGTKVVAGVELGGSPVIQIQNIDDVVVSYIFKTLNTHQVWEDVLVQGGPISGTFTALGNFFSKNLLVVESYECGKALQLATGYSVAVANFSANIQPVCAALRKRYPNSTIVVCCGEYGRSNKSASAEALLGIATNHQTLIAFPHGQRSFSELFRASGPAAVADSIEAATGPYIGSSKTHKAGDNFLKEVAPWPSPINGDVLVQDIVELLNRYVSLPEGAAIAVALWVLFSHTVDAARVAPILAILSPVKKCGKTTLLGVLRRIVHRALPSSNLTPAVLFRTIHAYSPTMLIDEADTFLFKSEELNGVLNSGHTRDTAFVQRIGKGNKPERFNTFGPKVIAKIGTLTDTLFDRSIIIQQQRKLKEEIKLKLREQDDIEFEAIHSRITRWAMDNIDGIATVEIEYVDLGNDRASDNWEPLLAIAKAVGPACYRNALKSAITLSHTHESASCNSEDLLKHTKAAFDVTAKQRFTTADLLDHLCADDELPWATFRSGKPITPREFATLMAPFGIKSKNLRMPKGEVVKGYELEQFEEAFSRYVPE